MPVKNRFAELLPEITAWRRDFHEHPELLYDVHRTAGKVADLVVLNNLQQEGAGFAVDTNIVSFVDSKREQTLPLLEKHEVADRILDEVADLLQRVL